MVHQEGLVLGMLAGGQDSSPCLLPARDNCVSPVLPNLPTPEGFPLGKPWESTCWSLCLLLPERGVSSIEKGGISTSCKHRGDLDQSTVDVWALHVPTYGDTRKQACA